MPTLNLQVASSADDGWFGISPTVGFNATNPNCLCGSIGGALYGSWHRFTGVSGLAGAKIDSAVLQLWGAAADVGAATTVIRAERANAPAAPTNQADAEGRTLTTAGVSWNSPGLSTGGYVSSPSLVSVIQELVDNHNPSAILIFWRDNAGSGINYAQSTAYDSNPARTAKLSITYTPKSARRTLLGVGS